jgi:uronate dehydrogenase
MEPAGAGEEVVVCDLADRQVVSALVEGCDAIVHLGGRSVEAAFDDILSANPLGTYDIYEAARQADGPPEDHRDPAVLFQGGAFAAAGHFEDEDGS